MSSSGRTERYPARLTLPDGFLILCLAVVAVGLGVVWRSKGGETPKEVEMLAQDQPPRMVPLDREGSYRLPGPLGDSVAEIRGGRVRMRASPCPNQLCVRQGWEGRIGQSILCAPNRVALLLRGRGAGPDAITR